MTADEKVGILLADDQLANRTALAAMLEATDCRVQTAESGAEALKHLLREDFAVILMDVVMPGMDGIETARLIRTRERSRNTPIIFLTANEASNERILEAYSLGAVDYLIKPVIPAILKAKVAFFVELFRMSATVRLQTELLAETREREHRAGLAEQQRRLQAEMEKEAARRDAAQHAVVATLATGGPFDELVPRLLESMCVALEWHWGFCWQVDALGKGLRMQAVWASPGIDTGPYVRDCEGVLMDLDAGLPGRAYKLEKVIWIPEVSKDHDLAHTALITCRFQEAGIHMAVAFPIRCEGVIVAVIILGRRNPGEPDEKQIRSFEVMGDYIGQYIARKRNEERLKRSDDMLRQSLKMEAMGRLAGGVAHDFNNLLTVISGYGEMLLEQKDWDEPEHVKLTQIMKAASQASELTGQLLAFGRKQKLSPKVLDLNVVVEDVKKILQRVIEEDIELVMSLQPGLGAIRADSGQLNQVIMNLAVNARDAMPEGGRILIETSETVLDDDEVGLRPMMEPGRYVQLAVTDTGTGMDADTKSRIFEPFFTTKAQGKGTGLGLSTVYGIVQQSGGQIFVYSEPGQGTCFKMYFPRVEWEASVSGSEPSVNEESGMGGTTIMVVEDESAIRELVCEVLRASGCQVLSATNPAEAMALRAQHLGAIDVLLTDVIMPGMHGTDLAERMTAGDPELRVLFMSGYTEQAALERALLKPGHAYLQKPFTPSALRHKVGEVLAS